MRLARAKERSAGLLRHVAFSIVGSSEIPVRVEV